MRIRRLAEGTINRIAAGEVVERPASAVKELVENAVDAGARNVDIAIAGGGMTLIRIADDGIGMSDGELKLAIERHATSKLPRDGEGEDDLTSIVTLGFRGEALPSIGAIARLAITSRAKGATDCFTIEVEGGTQRDLRPAPFEGQGTHGTIVEVRDLFYATKAGTRLMLNTSPEPVSNWTASISGDFLVLGGLWTALNHPIFFLILFIGFIVLNLVFTQTVAIH